MNPLTLAQLDKLAAAASEAQGEIDLDGTVGVGCLVPATDLADLVELARLQVALNECEAAMPTGYGFDRLWRNAVGGAVWEARAMETTGWHAGIISGRGATALAAVLALAVKLRENGR